MKTVRPPTGEHVPALGQGTWNMGEKKKERAEEIAALRLGVDLGLSLIDTAEMYGDGQSEELIAEAIDGLREQVFLVSKVLPEHATRRGTIKACEGSLRRLKTDWLDLYLLHWREEVPLEEALAGFETLVQDGKIRHWGVSNDNSSPANLQLERGRAPLCPLPDLQNYRRPFLRFHSLCRFRTEWRPAGRAPSSVSTIKSWRSQIGVGERTVETRHH